MQRIFLSTFSLALFSFLFLSSCGGNDPSDPGNRLSGSLVGRVELYDKVGHPLSDHSGAVVTVEGTDHTATSDAQGDWELKDLPAGTYVLSITKSGFTTVKEFGVAFVGGGTDYLPRYYLAELPTYRISNLKPEMVDKEYRRIYVEPSGGGDSLVFQYVTVPPRPVLSGVCSEPVPAEGYRVQFYVGRNPDVSKEPGTFTGMFETIIRERSEDAEGTPPLQGDFTFWIDRDLERAGFSKGERVYVVAYPVAWTGTTYYDPVARLTVDTRVVDAPSNVADFVWQ